MFCYQCEQTAKGTGCTVRGVCGKDPEVAVLQDLLIHAVKGISMYAHRAAQLGARSRDVDVFVIESMFATLTNVNFDPQDFAKRLAKAGEMLASAKALYEKAAKAAGKTPEELQGPATYRPASNLEGLLKQADSVGIARRTAVDGDVVVGLQELITYGIKGAAAYLDHAQILGNESPEVYAKVHEMMDALARDVRDIDELAGRAFKTGEINLAAMELLYKGNTGAYGKPAPTAVRITPAKGKAILISGHDLKDLEELLKQTEGKGINVYTHGEMLAAHGYPALKKFKHLVGNYGGAWQEQKREFAEFPGAILMTTNCLMRPEDSYKDRIFTSGVTGFPGMRHISNRDFSPVIDAALKANGFTKDEPEKTITVGFGHDFVLSIAGTVIEAVQKKQVRHFFLIGGCDGAKPGRNYYTDFAQKVPKDCVILTLACGKYRFNKLDFGAIGGIPRLLDVGQCNDAYSAVQIAVALAGAFKCGVNDLPLSLVLSWYEQKAVAILLTLLHLGIKNIRIGPSLPAFVTPPVLDVLVKKFNIMPISTPDADLKAILG